MLRAFARLERRGVDFADASAAVARERGATRSCGAPAILVVDHDVVVAEVVVAIEESIGLPQVDGDRDCWPMPIDVALGLLDGVPLLRRLRSGSFPRLR